VEILLRPRKTRDGFGFLFDNDDEFEFFCRSLCLFLSVSLSIFSHLEGNQSLSRRRAVALLRSRLFF